MTETPFGAPPPPPEYVPWDVRAAADRSRLLAEAHALFGQRMFTVGTLLSEGVAPPLESAERDDVAKSVGRVFVRIEGCWVDGFRVVGAGRDGKTKVRRWQIESR